MKYSIILLALLLVSCKREPIVYEPIVLTGIFYQRPYKRLFNVLILGSDTQAVDSIYEQMYDDIFPNGFRSVPEFAFTDSVLMESYVRKYYIPQALVKDMNNYIMDHCNKEVDYEIVAYRQTIYKYTVHNRKGKPVECGMNNVDEAKIYNNELKKIIESSLKDTLQRNPLLVDLLFFTYSHMFLFREDQKEMGLRYKKTPEERKKYIKGWEEIKQLESLELKELQDKSIYLPDSVQ